MVSSGYVTVCRNWDLKKKNLFPAKSQLQTLGMIAILPLIAIKKNDIKRIEKYKCLYKQSYKGTYKGR